MVADDLHEVLLILYNAGASRVPASDVEWSTQMAPALNRAFSMQYIIYRDTSRGRRFSLTESGYLAIGKEPPNYMSISRMFRSMLGLER
ncbi:hypothetical protein EPK99_15500 [Neorhizobium lilium]|uniref:Uncharacterized protein n=1 Tax=Neorhizobium lilium TaxID=2503024 RepID=A0A3S4UMK6_9HYPH|nr:hypothetical protein [Neorhizobium lilium]RWX77063.1 hypothetical protein EPK99_15500 [Neorhizobium lilium]